MTECLHEFRPVDPTLHRMSVMAAQPAVSGGTSTAIQGQLRLIIILVVVGILLLSAFAYVFARVTTRPIEELGRASQLVAAGDLRFEEAAVLRDTLQNLQRQALATSDGLISVEEPVDSPYV